MNLFAEDKKELNSGLIGLDVTLRSDDVPITDSFREFVRQFGSKCGDFDSAFDLGFFSTVAHPFGLHGACHGHVEANKLSHFSIGLRRKPESTPPESLVKINELIGGRVGMMKGISFLGDPNLKWRAYLEVVVLNPKKWPLKIKRGKQAAKMGNFKMEREEINLKNSKDDADLTIVFMPNDSTYIIQVKSMVESKLNEGCFEFVSQELWDKVQPIFLKK